MQGGPCFSRSYVARFWADAVCWRSWRRARTGVSKSENTPAAVRCHVGKNKKRWGDVKKTSKATGTLGGPSQVDLKSSPSLIFSSHQNSFLLSRRLPTNFRRFLSNYHSNMKLFAFLLVVLVGAAQAFVAPSAFKGTAMTSPRATRGERACGLRRVFRERCDTERDLQTT